MIRSDPTLIERSFVWQPKVEGRSRDIPIQTLSHSDIEQAEQRLHLYLGLGEERRATRRAINLLGECGIAASAIILPFHHLPAEHRYFQQTMIEVPHEAAENEYLNPSKSAKVNLVGSSQGGGVVLATASEAPELFDSVGALAPVGFNSESLGLNDRQRITNFWLRIGRNALKKEQNLVYDFEGNLGHSIEGGSRIIEDLRARRLGAKLSFALGFDVSEAAVKLSRTNHVRIFAGRRDPLFPPWELRATLHKHGLEDHIEEIPGSHPVIQNRGGRQQLRRVVEWALNTTK